MLSRWWTYQRERFPVLAHAPLIAAFSLSSVTCSALLRDPQASPRWSSWVVAFVVSFTLFLQLRVADEFKDAEEDAAHRPYRPVPRGLVTLRELGVIFAVGLVVQLAATLWLDVRLLVLLGVTWAYLAAMCAEFRVRAWLKARPVVYMASHMLILPVVDGFATACDWVPVRGVDRPPWGVVPFLLGSLANGFVVEIGRKLRAAADEEPGVETYSKLWGPRRATVAWSGCLLTAYALALVAASQVGWLLGAAITLTPAVLALLWVGRRYVTLGTTAAAKRVEPAVFVWTLLMYLSLGPIPWLVRLLT